MKKSKFSHWFKVGIVSLSLTSVVIGCKKNIQPGESGNQQDELLTHKGNDNKKVGHFNQVNLVANVMGYGAAHIDPTLVNAWGLAFSPTGIGWVSSQGGHVSDVYNAEGVTVLGPVHIPNPALPEGGNPTGVVFNGSATDFMIPGGPARFIFVGVDGVVSAWNASQGNHAFRKFAVPLSAYTGLTLAMNGTNNLLYAANFRAGRIDVWDGNWNPVMLSFHDGRIPAGYSPFNIQNIGGNLFVTYAKVAADGRSEAGDGKGFVDIYNPNGMLLKRFASRETLNAPWGLTMANRNFFKNEMGEMDEDDDDHHHGRHDDNFILVGNFGNGRINVFRTDGKFVGQLRGNRKILEIEGLWAIVFPPATSTIDPNRLYFAAGPEDETHGLFGYIIADKDHDDED